MQIKLSPCAFTPGCGVTATELKMIDTNTLSVDGESYVFGVNDVAWPDIAQQTAGAILEAHREDGELCLTVTRFYPLGASIEWDDQQYRTITIDGPTPGDVQ